MSTPPASRTRRLGVAAALATVIAIPAEGLRQVAYYDPPGVLTVCYGSTTNVVAGKRYSLQECRERLDADMLAAVTQVDACHPGLPEGVLVAFADAVYNLGPGIACNAQQSTAARLLAAKAYEQACRQLPRWDKARVAGQLVPLPGLTKRRNAEMQICLEGLS